MNNDNLIPFDQRTESEQREIRSKGGKRSGEIRRGKALMRYLLSLPEVDRDLIRECVEKMGIPEEDLDQEMVMHARQVQKAKRKADTAAYREVMKVAGYTDDAQAQNISITISPEAAKAGAKWSSKK